MNSTTKSLTFATTLCLAACQPTTETIEVLSFEKIPESASSAQAICSNFSFNIDKVSRYFLLAKPVSGEQFHDEAIILPCGYQGQLTVNGHNFDWQIHAAGAGYLIDGQNTQRFICQAGGCCQSIEGLC